MRGDYKLTCSARKPAFHPVPDPAQDLRWPLPPSALPARL